MRHTKILATLGPSTETSQHIKALIAAGVDAFRLNFSHGTMEWHEMVFHRIRQAADEMGQAIAIVQDLQGPKIRLGEIEGKGITLIAGATTIITSCPVVGTTARIPSSFTNLPLEVSPGNRILIDEGQIQLTVTEVKGKEIHCLIDIGGTLTSRKGMHVPGLQSKIPSLTDKDKEDARLGLGLGFDYIALSFVRRPEDVHYLRDWMHQLGYSVPIISKIETHEAVEHLEGIISASDGVMVARGDLGIETTLELIPYYQKKIIQLANSAGKIVITATQMLESMISNISPTRAEITDIANSILDGTDAMMLSGETAIGQYPIETVKQMATIAATTEKKLYPFDSPLRTDPTDVHQDLASSMAHLIGQASRDLMPKAIAVFTCTGSTAILMSGERSLAPVFAFTPRETSYNRLSLVWGVFPRKIPILQIPSKTVTEMTRQLLESNTVESDDWILFLFGSNASLGYSNSIRIARAGTVIEEDGFLRNQIQSAEPGLSISQNQIVPDLRDRGDS